MSLLLSGESAASDILSFYFIKQHPGAENWISLRAAKRH